MVKLVKIKSKKWKPVQIGGDNFSSELEGLISLEELTDYNLECTDSPEPEVVQETKVKKRKKRKIKASQEAPEAKVGCWSVSDQEVETKPCDNHEENEDLSTAILPWTNLFVPKEIAQSLVEQGFQNPTEIQRLSIPAAIKGRRDLLGAAETGSGKTLAFGIPIIYGILKNLEKLEKEADEVKNDELNRLWALVVTPTRELAMQVKNHLEVACKYTPVKVAVVVGGMSSEKQTRVLSKKPHIVVGTPGRLWELISLGENHLSHIETLKFLAIDETDRMLEASHFPELKSLLERINHVQNDEHTKLRQNFVFSATLTLVHDPPRPVQKKGKKVKRQKKLSSSEKLKSIMEFLGITDPKIVDITSKQRTAEHLIETRITCSLIEKDYYLYYLLGKHPGRTVVFCNSISCVRRLASLLNLLKMRPLPLHANMIQKQRLKNLDKFKEDSNGVLLATDVAARGLDIPNVQNVIHYQLPRTSENYIHRSGRTARADKEGVTVLFVEPSETFHYIKLLKTLGREKDIPDFPVDDSVLQEVKKRIHLARDLDRMELSVKKLSSEVGWLEKAAQDMDMIIDDDLMPDVPDSYEDARIRQSIKSKRKQLNTMLAEPLVRVTSYTATPVQPTSALEAAKQVSKPLTKIYKKNTTFSVSSACK